MSVWEEIAKRDRVNLARYVYVAVPAFIAGIFMCWLVMK